MLPQTSNITVSAAVSNFRLTDKLGQPVVPGEGHIHYFLDVVPPVVPGQPATTTPGTFVPTVATSHTWNNITPGTHILSVELVNNDHTPLEPPVVASVSVNVSGEPVPVPPGGNFFGPPGIDILDMAVASDGVTIFVAAKSNTSSKFVYKSLNSGITWADLSQTTGLNINNTDLIAVAPDDPDIVVVADALIPAAYVTIDGGFSWYSLGAISSSGGTAARLYDIDISGQRNGIRYVAVATTLNPGDTNVPALFYFNLGAVVPVWKDAVRDFTAQGGRNLIVNEIDAIKAVQFSPAFSSDLTLTAVSEQRGTPAKNGASRFHLISLSNKKWDADAGFTDYPVMLISSNGISVNVGHASISLDPEYQATDITQRIAFVGAQITDSTHHKEMGGIYRLNDTDMLKILDAPVYDVAFNGTNLVAGATTDGAVTPSHTVYYCLDPLSDLPIIDEALALKRPSGTTAVIVAWAGDNIVAGTSGSNSAFSISSNNGQSFNGVSLIDPA